MSVVRACAVAVTLVLAGCASAPDVVPFRGAAPSRLAVLPVASSSESLGPMAGVVESSLHAVLRDHGYGAVPAEVVARVDGAGGAPTPDLLTELVRVFQVDSVLITELRAVTGAAVAGPQEIALRWTFLDPADGRVLWTEQEVAVPGQVIARHLGSPGSRFEADPFFQDEPQVGRGGQTWVTEVRARSPEELGELLLRGLLARLPQGPGARSR